MNSGDKIAAGVFGVLTLLALAVFFGDYARNAAGVNQGLGVVGATAVDLYAIAGGQHPSFNFSGGLG